MAIETTRCLVTGGAGFIGSHLVERLVQDGFQTTVLDDLSAGSSSYVNDAATLVEGDVQDADYVFHLSAYTSAPGSLDEPQLCFEINTLGTLNILPSSPAAPGMRAGRPIPASSRPPAPTVQL